MNPYDESNEDVQIEEIRVRIQALVDNELRESEIEPLLEEIQGSYAYRAEYAELLKLRRRLGAGVVPPVSSDWVARAQRRISRRLSQTIGATLLVGSYVALLGYALVTLFAEPDVPRPVAILVALGVAGVVALLANAIADRIRERKTDRYREIIR